MGSPTILDLFCGAGGASMGYHTAGFEVIGVDKDPQPNYPFRFVQMDWEDGLADIIGRVDAIHASPPCQRYSPATYSRGNPLDYPDLVDAVRDALINYGVPYIIENVPQAPLINPTTLCGTMFNLKTPWKGSWLELRRHRDFETNWPLKPPGRCFHLFPSLSVAGNAGGSNAKSNWERLPGILTRRDLMQINWMRDHEIAEAIPPVYTYHIGVQLLRHLEKGESK